MQDAKSSPEVVAPLVPSCWPATSRQGVAWIVYGRIRVDVARLPIDHRLRGCGEYCCVRKGSRPVFPNRYFTSSDVQHREGRSKPTESSAKIHRAEHLQSFEGNIRYFTVYV